MESKESVIRRIVKLEHKMFREIHTNTQGEKCKEREKLFILERKSVFKPLSYNTLKSYLNGLEDAIVEGRNLLKEKYLRMDESSNIKDMKQVDSNLKMGYERSKTQCDVEGPPDNLNSLDEEHKILIQKIIKIESKWQIELKEKYPNIFKTKADRSKGLNFEKYLKSELETYPPLTIEYYFQDVLNAEKEGRNLALEGYEYMFKELNYSSLEEVNKKDADKKTN
ncbi:MAG: DUF4125 family protein [Atribacterota bacterium]